MILRNYGLELVRLRSEHIEMVRQWRNADQIARHMEFREQITSEMQKRWFHSINNLEHFYFLIRVEEKFLGLINLSSIDQNEAEAHAGLFISHPDYISTTIPVRASLGMLDFALGRLGLKRILAKVKKGNQKARSYNEKLGFRFLKDAEHPDFEWLQLTDRGFYECAAGLRKTAGMIYGNEQDLILDPSFEIDGKLRDILGE